MLRPSATWEITDGKFTKWEDDRPQPSMEEVRDVQQKARDFEDSINTIWTEKTKLKLQKCKENKWGFRLITHSLFPTAVTFLNMMELWQRNKI